MKTKLINDTYLKDKRYKIFPDRDTLQKEYDSGKTFRELAVQYGMTHKTMLKKAKIIGIIPRHAGKSQQPINKNKMIKHRIKHAAIKVNDIVYIGHRHHNCFAVISECGVNFKLPNIILTQGFVDEGGNFWDRKDSLVIAKHFNQIVKKHSPLDQLMSEDLY